MATLLYRLGTIAAHRAKTIIAAWFAILAVAATAFLSFGGQLSDQISIPGLETTRVADRLAEEIPDASGGSAQAVFRTQDGEAFTQEQQQQIADLLDEIAEHSAIDGTTDPFSTEAELSDAATELASAREELENLPEDFSINQAREDLEAGEAELEAGEAEIEASRAQIEAGWDELDTQLEAADLSVDELSEAREDIDSGFAELDAADAQIDSQVQEALAGGYWNSVATELNAARAEVVAQRAELEAADAQLSQAEAGAAELRQAESQVDAGAEELAAGREELEDGREQLAQFEEAFSSDEDPTTVLDRNERLLEISSGASMVSEDGSVAVGMLAFHVPVEQVGMDDLAAVSEMITEADIDGVDSLPSGDLNLEMPHLFSVAEAIGLMIAAIVLLVMLGTFIGAGLPLLNALVGVGIGVAGALAFSSAVEMMSVTPILGIMLGLAVGIDYSLFIIHRHRRQLKDGMDLRESIALANGTAGNAVVFAGATVVIALMALNVTGLPFLAMMGTVAAACVVVAVLIATTMTPALLSLVGYRILRHRERRYMGLEKRGEISEPMHSGKAAVIVLGSLLILGIMAIPTFSLRLGLPDASTQPEDSAGYQAFEATEEAFGQGMNGPLVVLADLPADLSDSAAQDLELDLAEALTERDDISAAVPVASNDDGDLSVFHVIPTEGPSSESVENLVHAFRAGEVLTGDLADEVELSVAGVTAANIDVSDVIADAMPLYLGLVVGLSLILMVMVFRSLLLPVIATLGFIGTISASIGAVVAVFQWGWLSEVFGISNPGPIVTFLPVLMIGILFGLAMDYQLFTASGMREAYAHGTEARLAVRRGLHAGRSVVTAAALIMASVFAGFIFTPDPMVAAIGMGLAVGVLLDAFVVRLLLVPAVLHLCGRAAWWIPAWLDRILPDVDVEGAALERSHPDVAAGEAESESTPSELQRV